MRGLGVAPVRAELGSDGRFERSTGVAVIADEARIAAVSGEPTTVVVLDHHARELARHRLPPDRELGLGYAAGIAVADDGTFAVMRHHRDGRMVGVQRFRTCAR